MSACQQEAPSGGRRVRICYEEVVPIIVPFYYKRLSIMDIATESGYETRVVREAVRRHLAAGGQERPKLYRRRRHYDPVTEPSDAVDRKCSWCREPFKASNRFMFFCDPCKNTAEWKSGA